MRQWTDEALEKARRIIAEEPELIEKAYGPGFRETATQTGLYFSFGDMMHFVHSSVRHSLSIRELKGGAGIAHFEQLILRMRVYLIEELKLVVEMKPPYDGAPFRFNQKEPDYNFIVEFLELFKELDQLAERLAEVRKAEKVEVKEGFC